MNASLVISTYNWPQALEIVLQSVLNQSHIPNDIIIADDGSTPNTKEIINNYAQKLKINHIWQKDNGFRKTMILNKAINAANNRYVIQIDGDIIMHKNFIENHISNSKKGQFIHGSRAFLNRLLTEKTIKKKLLHFNAFQKGITNRINAIHSNILSILLSKRNTKIKGTRGCNFSFWKDDFIAVNGYNEDIVEWGKEDTELSVRLINNGIKKLQLKNNALCYHLHHNNCTRKKLHINNAILERAINQKKKSCKNGVSKYATRDK